MVQSATSNSFFVVFFYQNIIFIIFLYAPILFLCAMGIIIINHHNVIIIYIYTVYIYIFFFFLLTSEKSVVYKFSYCWKVQGTLSLKSKAHPDAVSSGSKAAKMDYNENTIQPSQKDLHKLKDNGHYLGTVWCFIC